VATSCRRPNTFGSRIASVIHLAAYFDLTGEPDPKYQEITVNGTRRLLSGLQRFDVEQFVFASTMLVHAAARPGETIDEQRPLEPKYPYRASKIETEQLIHQQRGSVPVVYLRAAGVYDDLCRNAFLARQIARIYERSPKSYVYPGDLATGQSYVHIDDLVEAFARLIERRKDLPDELPLLLGEPDAMGYGELQEAIARHLHGTDWPTWEIPKPIAKAGSYVEADVLGEDPFIRPWMVDIADDHYGLDITRARELLGWEPGHSLRDTIPKIIRALKEDPVGWYRANKLNAWPWPPANRPCAQFIEDAPAARARSATAHRRDGRDASADAVGASDGGGARRLAHHQPFPVRPVRPPDRHPHRPRRDGGAQSVGPRLAQRPHRLEQHRVGPPAHAVRLPVPVAAP
jgi:nucleoside-diphosphate-sugar epimerase